MIKYIIGSIGILLSVFFGLQSYSFAGGCYMPRTKMTGSAKTKQAVYIRSMPCMEEGKTLATTKSKELLTISQESDGRYQLTRSDGTIGWIYYTRLTDINTQNSYEDKEEQVYQTPTKSYAFPERVQTQLDNFVKKLVLIYPYQEDEQGNKVMHPGMETIRQKLLMIKNSNPKAEKIVDYLFEALEAYE